MVVRKIVLGLAALFFCLFVFPSLTFSAEKYFEKFYCSLLGKEDASCKYKEIIREALHAFGVKEFEHVPIKKIGKLPLRLIGDGYVSFAMDGIWLNEERLDMLVAEIPESEIIFILFLETARYVHRDHGKQIISLLPAACFFYAIPSWSAIFLDNQNKWVRYCCVGVAAVVTLLLLDHLFMLPLARYLDKNAELAAMKALWSIHKGDIIQAHIDYLKSMVSRIDDVSGTWSHSLQERIAYIAAYYKELGAQAEVNA